MFENLGQRLTTVFDRLKGRGSLTEGDVNEAMREIRIALLEADVALSVVRDFIAAVKEKAIGTEVLRSITPGQMIVKIVHDKLIDSLEGRLSIGDSAPAIGAKPEPFKLSASPPIVMLLVGLQGAGKTTTAAKLALRFKSKDKKSVLMASLDIYRPAAQEQLAILGRNHAISTLPIVAGESVAAISRRALSEAKKGGFDILVLDSAGRLAIDAPLMEELQEVRRLTKPVEILLVADAMTGQDAVNSASAFNQSLDLSGIILTRVDGDARGGAALSMRAVTGKPIKLLGVGEKIDNLEEFNAERIAGRILGMGDIVGLVEKAGEVINQADAEKLAMKMAKGNFDLDDYAAQLKQMRKMGGMGGLMAMLPGVAKVKKQLEDSKLDDRILLRQEAIILSMTKRERRDWKLLNAKRKIRIAKGSGTQVPDINRLLKQFQEVSNMMKKMRGMQNDPKSMQRMMGAMPKQLTGGAGGGLAGLGGGNMGGMASLMDRFKLPKP